MCHCNQTYDSFCMFTHAYFHHNVYLNAYSSLCLYTQHPPRTGVPNSWRSTTHSPERAIATRLTTVSACFTHAYTCSHMPTLPKCLFQCLFHFMYVYPAHSSNRCLLAGGPRPIHLNVPLQPTLRHLLHVHTCLS